MLTQEQDLAELIHKKTCHRNHTDDCFWLYDTWDNKPLGWAKNRYLEMAKRILKKCEYRQAKYLLNCLE